MSIDKSYSLESLRDIDKPIKFLQIPESTLRRFGISSKHSIAKLIELLEEKSNHRHGRVILRNIQLLEKNTTITGEIDWFSYYSQNRYGLLYLNFECRELNEIATLFPTDPITEYYFGLASISLFNNNISTIGELADYLSSWRYNTLPAFGKKKSKHLFTGLMTLIKDYQSGVYVSEAFERNNTYFVKEGFKRNNTYFVKEGFKWNAGEFNRLSSNSINLPISCINLGKKSKHLKQNGIITLGDLINEFRQGIRKFDLVGSTAMELWLANLVSLSQNINESGDIDWRGYCIDRGLKYLPYRSFITNGKSFLESIPAALDELSGVVNDPLSSSILLNRISVPYEKRMTLEELGEAFDISRQRVRQKESKLIAAITDALIYDKYQFLNYRFSSYFAKYFKDAAFYFDQATEIHFDKFLSLLSEIWRTEKSDIVPHLPIITSILTGESITPVELRVSKSLPVRFYKERLPPVFEENSLKNIRLGKLTDKLEYYGVRSIGELIEVYRSDSLPLSATDRDKIFDYLSNLDISLNEYDDSDDFWLNLAVKTDLRIIPDRPVQSPSDFLNIVVSTLSDLIQADYQYKFAIDVFSTRTSKPFSTRPTLEKSALIIGTRGSSLKRTETNLIKYLHQLFFGRDFRHSSVYVMPDFLGYWGEVHTEYLESNKHFDDFEASLIRKWQIQETVLEEKLDLLWTICNIYPNGRNRQLKKLTGNVNIPPKQISVIKLKGFKTVC